ncbi:hypothetical protein J6Z48_00795 [bacterium]|nr:hypothetical protein [bacterium]
MREVSILCLLLQIFIPKTKNNTAKNIALEKELFTNNKEETTNKHVKNMYGKLLLLLIIVINYLLF